MSLKRALIPLHMPVAALVAVYLRAYTCMQVYIRLQVYISVSGGASSRVRRCIYVYEDTHALMKRGYINSIFTTLYLYYIRKTAHGSMPPRLS